MKPDFEHGQSADSNQNRADKNFLDDPDRPWKEGLPGRAYTLECDLGRFAKFDQTGWESFLKAKSTEEIEASTARMVEHGLNLNLPPLQYVLECLTDLRKNQTAKGYPKGEAAVIRFLAGSLASWGQTSPSGKVPIKPRTSRDLVGNEKKKADALGPQSKAPFYIKCTCGYKGPVTIGVCPNCMQPLPGLMDEPAFLERR